MGVPAFFRWLSEKYPKIVEDVLEARVDVDASGTPVPFDSTLPNPSKLEIDNLYIDMNGIIHPCSHPENGPQPKTEVEMYENVCRYVDRLFRAARPRKLLYLAIDGVAPRAKMNQQRSRRFRSAQEADEKKEIENRVKKNMSKEGMSLPSSSGDVWDSNVITPGTKFMLKLSEYLKFYIRKRMSEDKAWKTIKVIFSDASIPGEGEHKIMSHIRLQRTLPTYNPNLVHCLHGLDADLIMLGLATHEAHFYILREEVLFGRRSAEANDARKEMSGFTTEQRLLDEEVNMGAMSLPENRNKPLVRISIPILREYLFSEFRICQRVPFTGEISFERVIDDIVFLCFFVGNDFLPHLPSLDIRDGGLDFLFNVYKKVLPTLGGYITDHGGEINLSHVDVILAEVGAIEDYVFNMRHEKEKRDKERRALQKEQNAKRKRGGDPDDPRQSGEGQNVKSIPRVKGRSASVMEKSNPSSNEKEVLALGRGQEYKEKKRTKKKTKEEKNEVDSGDTANSMVDESPMSEDKRKEIYKNRVKAIEQEKLDKFSSTVEDKVRLHEEGWKDRYYTDKCKADNIDGGGGREHLFRSYVKGLCWVMKYYYSGVPSWKWYYPFHYAPFASDLKNIERFQKDCGEFELSKPFSPVEQLMSVLPEASSHAIPEASRWLMRDPESPIIDFYPKDILVDPNGKAMPWLWVVLLPFIDADRLLDALNPTREKWSKFDLLSDARGMDDGYLFVHKSHSLFPVFEKVMSYHDKLAKHPLPKDHFNGSVRPAVPSEQKDLLKVVHPPKGTKIICKDGLFDQAIPQNQCICVAFSEPKKKIHLSILLPNVKLNSPVLSGDDFKIRRPRLGHGASIATFGGNQRNRHGGGMNVDRDVRSQQPGGHLPTGMRQWGSLEPSAKRARYNNDHAPPYNQNRFNGNSNNSSNYNFTQFNGHNNRNNNHVRFDNNSNNHRNNHNNRRPHLIPTPQIGRGPSHPNPNNFPRNHQNTNWRPPSAIHQPSAGGHHANNGYSFNQRPSNNYNNRNPQRNNRNSNNNDAKNISADLMNNLRSQLKNTLQKNKRSGN